MPKHPSDAEKPTSMKRADVANGESPEEDDERAATDTTHPTGKRQAAENQENDPPA